MINLQNINFSYQKGRTILNDLCLSLEGGHIYGLFGKNGAGKTTLLKIMAGLRFAQSGTSTTLDHRAELREAEMLKDIYFLQEEIFVPDISISNFVKCYAPFYENFDYEQFEEYMHLFEITSMNDKLTTLSYGQRKKVIIGFALARFVYASFTNGVFDRFINSRMEGVEINRGLAKEEDEEEDEDETAQDGDQPR